MSRRVLPRPDRASGSVCFGCRQRDVWLANEQDRAERLEAALRDIRYEAAQRNVNELMHTIYTLADNALANPISAIETKERG
jgi:hypothetical protein